jgi:FKBP-type peptidyl-prolyl cis-trans isomerase
MKTVLVILLLVQQNAGLVEALSLFPTEHRSKVLPSTISHDQHHLHDMDTNGSLLLLSRRKWWNRLIQSSSHVVATTCAVTTMLSMDVPTVAAVEPQDPRRTVILHLESPNVKAGLELMDVTIGTPPQHVAAIRRVLPQGVAGSIPFMQPGLVLRDYTTAAQVVERLSQGPYPMDLIFENLAAGGDAFGELQKPLVTAQDALELSSSTSSSSSSNSLTDPTSENSGNNNYVVRDVKTTPQGTCPLKSRRGDVLEIVYEAHLNGPNGPIYDASEQRGTGLPYQMVLGSGDMLSGVDQGLYNMCPGDMRALTIPPPLAYGTKGNRLWDIPPNTKLYWTVELVSVNSVREGDGRSREAMEGRVL